MCPQSISSLHQYCISPHLDLARSSWLYLAFVSLEFLVYHIIIITSLSLYFPFWCSAEWQWLKSLKSPSCPLDLHSSCPQSLQQLLLPGLQLFLKNLGFNPEDASHHQLYVQEVIELNEDITILIVLPPPDQVCTAPGSTDHFVDNPDFVALPISTFEISELVCVCVCVCVHMGGQALLTCFFWLTLQ